MSRYIQDTKTEKVFIWTEILSKKPGFEEIDADTAHKLLGIGPEESPEPAPEPAADTKAPAKKDAKKKE